MPANPFETANSLDLERSDSILEGSRIFPKSDFSFDRRGFEVFNFEAAEADSIFGESIFASQPASHAIGFSGAPGAFEGPDDSYLFHYSKDTPFKGSLIPSSAEQVDLLMKPHAESVGSVSLDCPLRISNPEKYVSGHDYSSGLWEKLENNCANNSHPKDISHELGKRSQQATESTAELQSELQDATRSKSEGEEGTLTPSDEDMERSEDKPVYVPYEYQGDGRKREAKRHKSRTVVPQEEIELEQMIKDY